MEKPYCYCGFKSRFEECCGRFLAALAVPETAEALMRSRYCAYVVRDQGYLLETWHPHNRPAVLTLDPNQRWLGLKIKAVAQGRAEDETGTVEFVARYKSGSRGYRLHETSQFKKESGRWFYLQGELHTS